MQKEVFSDLLKQAQHKLDRKTKPVGSLGKLETLAAQLAAIQGSLEPNIDKKRMLIFAASHGIAAEGVSAYPPEVTGQMVLNFLNGGAAINVLSRHGKMNLHVIDVGVDVDLSDSAKEASNFFSRRVTNGTKSFLREPAMTAEECEAALKAGYEQVQLAHEQQVRLLGIGEMGIGNTTAAAALFSALLNIHPEEIVGPGTGLNEAGVRHKALVIQKALDLHREKSGADPVAWLQHVGGLEIAAMTGVILEAYRLQMPVVVDGFIATSAAMVALQIEPAAKQICFFGHRSNEKAHRLVLEKLDANPVLDLEMRLGEGTGAALAMHLLDAAAKIMCEMATFDTAGVSDSEQDANKQARSASEKND
ncbi:nicotinate-nucleotide/dimethylbenzimidazole phosphoribosyltransferase [Chloroherpeton thalassium ATCC 35110]|uniref:Nicotinate-nucleotide--dimethylbenzimidazole phosphoribosyltransferase n=1 Tax=Chloroherpeton thalassium (strain ATCC 35110 / GB-78) TaxID=517418 RepID=B3QSI7_CHLT3|nr:nicotinate-nucleotide--dimethylbenzimidazole phosphoribosyltransferase [Chloroherpeton thalassium]ACF12578.1 nicotinate-nucleotide/dimethylbenzimidazole phosphoribosyltransferase [Chloroherpeton thalassium ATCC 35110]